MLEAWRTPIRGREQAGWDVCPILGQEYCSGGQVVGEHHHYVPVGGSEATDQSDWGREQVAWDVHRFGHCNINCPLVSILGRRSVVYTGSHAGVSGRVKIAVKLQNHCLGEMCLLACCTRARKLPLRRISGIAR